MKSGFIKGAAVIFLLAVMFFLPGCLGRGQKTKTLGRACVLPPDFEYGGRVSVFIRQSDPAAPRVWLKIAAVEILSGDTWIPLSTGAVEIDTGELGRGQLLVGRRKIPAGTCKALRFDLVKAALVKKDGSRVLLMLDKPEAVVRLASPLELGTDASESLFLVWDVARTVRDTVFTVPVLSVATSKELPLVSDIACVSCPDIDTVYMFRTDRNWVHGSIGIGGGPRQLFIDRDNSRLYVLAAKSSTIIAVDLKANRVVDRIHLSMVQEADFMAPDSDASNVFVVDAVGNYLARYDLASGNLAARARIGQKINYIRYLPDHERVAVASAFDQTVYLVNPDDLAVQEEIRLDGMPQGMAVDEDRLYIAEESGDTVAVYDLATRQMLKRVRVGMSPYRIEVVNGEVLVSNREGATVSIFRSGQIYASRSLRGAAVPTELAASVRNHWIYVADSDCGGVRVFDMTSKTTAGLVDLKSAPADIEVLN